MYEGVLLLVKLQAKACNFNKSNTTLHGGFTQCPTDFIANKCSWGLGEILETHHSSSAF